MGVTVNINSIEKMCDLMCDNKLPKRKRSKEEWWIFTFGCGQPHAGKYVKIKGSFEEARSKMVEKYGVKWAFQRSEDEWKSMEQNPNRWWPMETELEVIE